MIIKEIEIEAIKTLENDTSCYNVNKFEDIENFKEWVNKYYKSNNIDALKSIVVGCALFRARRNIEKMLSKNEIDKQTAKYKIEVSNIYIKIAQSFLIVS